MRSFGEALLYAILDLGYVSDDNAPRAVEQLIRGGADVVQLRGKLRSIDELSRMAEELLQITASAGVPLIINDHPRIAGDVRVSGVHVGQDDDTIARVRSMANRQIIVGKSTHSVEQAVAAECEGADYIGFGPLFATPTKPDYQPIGLAAIRQVHQRVRIPIFCIGGIKLENLPDVLAAGAARVVIVSGLLQSSDPRKYASSAKQLLINQAAKRVQ